MHGQVGEFSAVREFAQYDEEDDQTGDPRPELVVMHDFVAEDGDEPRRRCDYDDASIARNVVVDRVDQLGANYDIHSGPAHTSEDVEACNCGATLVAGLLRGRRVVGVQENASLLGEARSHLLTLTPWKPKKKRESTIWRKPKRGPKVEKNATGVMARQLMKRMARRESTKPRSKTGTAKAPIAKEETTMFADIHCESLSAPLALAMATCWGCPPVSQLSSDLYPSAHLPVLFRFLGAQHRTGRLLAGSWHIVNRQ